MTEILVDVHALHLGTETHAEVNMFSVVSMVVKGALSEITQPYSVTVIGCVFVPTNFCG